MTLPSPEPEPKKRPRKPRVCKAVPDPSVPSADSGSRPGRAGPAFREDEASNRPANPKPDAASVLERIRQELDALQTSISAREAALVHRESQVTVYADQIGNRMRELAAASDRLAHEREQLERDRAALRTREGIIAKAQAHEAVLAQRERALAEREESLANREEAMQRSVDELRRQAAILEEQRAELDQMAVAAAPLEQVGSARSPGWLRVALVCAAAIVAGAALFRQLPRQYAMLAAWTRNDDVRLERETILAALKDPSVHVADADDASVTLEAEGPVLRLRWTTVEPNRDAKQLRAWAVAATDVMNRIIESGDASAADRERIRHVRSELAALPPRATSQPTTPPADSATASAAVRELLERGETLAAERRALGDELDRTRREMVTLQHAATQPAAILISEAERQAAEDADRELAQALRRVKIEQDNVRSLASAAHASGRPRLDDAVRAIDGFTATIETVRRSPPDAAAEKELADLQADAAACKEKITTFAAAWDAFAAKLATSRSPVDEQRSFEPTAREFASAAQAAVASIERRVRAIGESGEQITKRLVVRSTLSKSLQEVTAAQSEVARGVAAGTNAGSFRLDAAMQTAEGVNETVRGRRQIVLARLQERAAAAQRRQREHRLQAAQQREQEILAAMAEKTDGIIAVQNALATQGARWVEFLAESVATADVETKRTALLRELAALHAPASASEPPTPPVVLVDAQVSRDPVNLSSILAYSVLGGTVTFALGVALSHPMFFPWLRRRLIRIPRPGASGRDVVGVHEPVGRDLA